MHCPTCCRLPLVPQAAEAAEGDDGDHRKGSQFKDHMKKSEAASEFSRTKTIAQQRRSLPVYQVRDELLQVRGRGRVPAGTQCIRLAAPPGHRHTSLLPLSSLPRLSPSLPLCSATNCAPLCGPLCAGDP